MADQKIAGGYIEISARGVKEAEKEIYEFADVYELAGKEVEKTTHQVDKFDQMLDELVVSLEGVRKKQDQVTDASKRGAAAMEGQGRAFRAANVGQAAMEASRAFEDLQYGIGGVVNNIPSLVMALGGTAGLAAAFSLVAVGMNQLIKHWPEFMGLFTERFPVPEATDKLTRYKDELKKVSEEHEALSKQTSLSGDELKRFNELTQQQIDLQKKVAEEEKKQRELKAILESESKEDKERGQGFMAAVAGRGEQLKTDITRALGVTAEDQIREYKRRMDDRLQKMLLGGATNAQMERAAAEEMKGYEDYSRTMRNGLDDLAKQMLTELYEGKQIGFDKLKNLMNAGTGIVIGGEGFRGAMEAESPEGKRAAKEAADFDKDAAATFKRLTDRAAAEAAAIDADNARQSAAGMRAIKQQEAKAAMAAKVRAQGEAAQNKRAVGEQIREEQAAIKAGGYDVMAAQEMARLSSQGGDVDRFGRFQRMNQGQIEDLVRQRVAQELQRRNPRMGAEQRGDLAHVITAGAAQLNNTGKLLGVAGQHENDITQLKRGADQMGRAIERLANQTKSRTRTAQKRPGAG